MNPEPIMPLNGLKSKTRKRLIKVVISILLVPVILIALLSPITKYVIETYDVEYTGREITIDYPYVNLFTGYIHLNNLKIKEENSDSVFFTASGIGANFSVYKLFSKTIEISELT